MRQHVSIFLLFARSTVYKLLLALPVLLAVQAGLFWLALSRNPAASLPRLVELSRLAWPFGAALAITSLILCRPGCDFGARTSYTLRRLSVSEKGVFLWQWLCGTLAFLVLWGAELALMLALCRVYLTLADPAQVNSQTVFLAFYRSDFLHTLLPLENVAVWVRNALLVLGLGAASAIFPFRQRRSGKPSAGIIVLTLAAAVFFPCGLNGFENIMLLSALSLVCIASAVWRALFVKEVTPDES